jgi:hypothetical protein
MISNPTIFEETGSNEVPDPVVIEIQLSESEIFRAAENKGIYTFLFDFIFNKNVTYFY